ncbi:BTB/POZ domain-containing protein 2-like [Mizuhopecten yessoensis]|uniref:BTB/POZ domain-containing protein 2 n=1 Tax=Mizuhopecten yessoensis TaxID=6573 RepID=A0A210QHM2_MIZYE|nr:BTB/POZ domain-containing protein 2-like [Mizuhopecten yessoensis]OWF48237.1 BTB/POZ domain-containing protein 2 [Mizuhopecten yessoensis]
MASGGDEPQDWRDNKSLVQCNRYILEQEIGCDVRFEVGEGDNQKSMAAHKSHLMARSDVFFAMFEGPMAEPNSMIQIPDIEPVTFKLMLQFIYCDDNKIDLVDSFPLLYAAQKYNLKGLAVKCVQRIRQGISSDKVCWIFMHGCIWSQDEVKDLCMKHIIHHSYAVFGSKGFLDMSEESLIEILKNGRLNMEEKDIFEAVVKWARRKCRTENNRGNLRNALVNILPHIRFARMELSYFSEKVSHMDILTPERLVETFRFLTSRKADHPDQPRDRRIIFERFTRVKSGKGYFRGNADAISFMLSEDARLHEVLVYGSCQSEGLYKIDIKVIEDGDRQLCRKQIDLETDGFTKTYPIEIAPPMMMSKNMCYTLLMVMVGPASYFGEKGVIAKQQEGLTITFLPNEKGLNGTNIKQGQFNSLVFKKTRSR